MDNQKVQRTYEFQKLTPYEKADLEGYEKALDFVFKNENHDLRNVALTGNYGSGKSSVIRSYAKEHKNLSFLYVSLAHFEGVSGETTNDNYDVDVEKKIINHIVQQIPTKDVPESGYIIKRNFNVGNGIWLVARIAFLIFAIGYLVSWKAIHAIQSVKIWSLLTGAFATAIILVTLFADIVSLLYSALKYLSVGRKIKSLKLQNGEVEFSDQNEKSYFDQHLDEILYLFAGAKADAFVFEDIDRFKEIDLKVLEHLRELCTLANDRIHNIDPKRKPIRFLYLIGDHVFKDYTDRTKFFDYMIPVIPVVDSSNSYAKLREFLEQSGDYEKLDDRFLRGLCLYLDDLRTIKNIVNEFQIYSAKLADTAKDANQLLALIAYKNLYPDDFSDLQQSEGYLFSIFSSKDKVINAKIEGIKNEIENYKEKLTKIEKEMLTSVAELDAVQRERQNYPSRFSDGISFKDWNSKEYPARKELIKQKTDGSIKKINEIIAEKQRKLTHIGSLHLSNLVDDDNEAVVFGYSKKDPVREKKENCLVEYFIKNGYIDETTYRDYIAFFYEKGMSYRDKDFLISVNSHNGKPFDYSIHNLDLVMDYLNADDFICPEIRNFMIVDYVLERNRGFFVQKLVLQLYENQDYEFIAQYLRVTKNKVLFIRALNTYWTESILAMISEDNHAMSADEIQNYVLIAIAYLKEDELRTLNQENLITIYISEKFDNATCEHQLGDAIGDALVTLDVEFHDIDKQIGSGELRTAIYTRSLYELNQINVESILEKEYNLDFDNIHNRELTAVMSVSKQPLSKYADDNINLFIADVVLCNDIIRDDPDVERNILNREDVLGELKVQYVSRIFAPFESLEGINEEQWGTILSFEKVICNPEEILRFFGQFGLTSELVGYINKLGESVDYTACTNKDTLLEFSNACMKNADLEDERYKMIMHQIGSPQTSFTTSGLGEEKVKILIEKRLIDMNSHNLQFIRQQYPKAIVSFVESDVAGYMSLSQGNNIKVDEVLMLLGDQEIDLDSRLKMIDGIPEVIPVRKYDYDEEIIKHIVCNKYDANDMPYLIKNYQKYSGELQEEIYKKLKSPIVTINNNIVAIAADKELLYRVFEDDGISFEEKATILDLLLTDKEEVNLEKLFLKMGLLSIAKLVSGDTSRLPRIKNGTEEKTVLKELKEHGYIEDYSVDDDTGTIKVVRKKSLFGGKHGK